MEDTSERALILAPLGRDAALAAAILVEAKIDAQRCEDVAALVSELQKGGGLALVSEEALQGADLSDLANFLQHQPEWSDFPFILLTFRGGGLERNPAAARLLSVLGNVTFLERPFHPTTLISLAQAALRGRRRQYQARNTLYTMEERERHFREVTESLPQLVWTCGPDGSCDYLSPQWYRYTGSKDGDPLGYQWLEQVHPEDRDRVASEWRRTAINGDSFEIEFRIRRYDAVYRWFRTLAVPLRDGAGKIAKWFGTNTDVDAIKQAEENLRTSETRLSAFISATSDVVYRMSPDWTEMRQLNGRNIIADTDTPSRTWLLEYIDPEDKPLVQKAIDKAIETKGAFDLEHRVKRADGTLGWTHSRAIPLLDAKGDILEWFGAASDITQRRHHEEQVQLLLREVNHRAKNMLSLVQAIAHLTASTGPKDFVQRFGERVKSLSAAQDLLIKHEWKAVPLADLIRLQLSHFADLIGGRITLSGPECSISQEAAQILGMALHELATNAAKYGALSNEAGKIAIFWHIEAMARGEPMFTLSWVERGGPEVVKPVRRGFGSKVTSTMVQKSVGGEVTVDYDPSGLAWRLECYASKISGGHPPAPSFVKPAVRAASGWRVLVVEDEPLVAADIADILESAGFQVLGPASNVREALWILQHEGCDTAVLDVNLGGESSEEVSRELNKTGTPFIVVSGYSHEQLPKSYRTVTLIQKPLQASVLKAELKRCLSNSRVKVDV